MPGTSKFQLRLLCDKFQSLEHAPNAPFVTDFDVPESDRAWAMAKLALDSYNQKHQKNFNLENVCKINRVGPYFCMTFRARNAETDECRLFRGVVYAFGNRVMLREIIDGDTILDTRNDVVLPSEFMEALSHARRNGATRGRGRI